MGVMSAGVRVRCPSLDDTSASPTPVYPAWQHSFPLLQLYYNLSIGLDQSENEDRPSSA